MLFAELDDTPRRMSLRQEIFAVNVQAYILAARAAVTELLKSGGSIIVTLSNASFDPDGGGALYVASKHADLGVVRQLASSRSIHPRQRRLSRRDQDRHPNGPRSATTRRASRRTHGNPSDLERRRGRDTLRMRRGRATTRGRTSCSPGPRRRGRSPARSSGPKRGSGSAGSAGCVGATICWSGC